MGKVFLPVDIVMHRDGLDNCELSGEGKKGQGGLSGKKACLESISTSIYVPASLALCDMSSVYTSLMSSFVANSNLVVNV